MVDINVERQSDEENDVINIHLDNSLNAERGDSIEDSLVKTSEEKNIEIEPAFTNPIYGENQENVEHTKTEKVAEDYFPADKQPPLDRLLKHVTEVDVSYNSHSALDRVLKSVEDNDSGGETSKLINNREGSEQLNKPIDSAVASIRHNPTLNLRHPIDGAFVTATQDPSKSAHSVVDRIPAEVKEESPVILRHPIDRIAGDDTAPKSVKKLSDTLSKEIEIPPAASLKPIDKLMRAALTANSESSTSKGPLDRLVKSTLHSEPKYNDRIPIDRLTQTLTGRNIGNEESINGASPLARLEALASK